MREKYTSEDYPDFKYPKSWPDLLTKDDWRKWVECLRVEWDNWIQMQAFKVVKWEDMAPGAILTRLYELFEIKKDGRYKSRPVIAGETMEKGIDHGCTNAQTLLADTLRFMCSFSAAINSEMWAGDLSSAFLLAKGDRPIYVYPPTWFHMLYSSWDDLAKMREGFLTILETKGRKALNATCRHTGQVEEVLEGLSAIYGNPAATRLFQNKNTKVITQDCGLLKSHVAGSLYYKVIFNSNASRKCTQIIDQCILVGTHVDDCAVTGSLALKKRFKEDYTKAMGGHVTWQIPATKFTACEFKQDLENGTFEMLQEEYWNTANKRFIKYLPDKYNVRNPVVPGTVFPDPKTGVSDADFQKAKHLPFPELVGTLNYPAQYTKIECQLAVAKLSRYMQKWTVDMFAVAIRTLMYCITNKSIGIVWTRDLDKHGVNVLYSHADSSFGPGRSDGCSYTV